MSTDRPDPPTDDDTDPDLDLIEGPTSASATASGPVDADDEPISEPTEAPWADASQPQPEPVAAPPARVGARSPFALHHLIFGVLFIAIGVFGIGGNADADVEWIWVGLLGGAGIAGLAAVLGSIRAART